MTSSERFPLYFPSAARRPFGGDDLARRVAKVAHLSGGSRVLDLAGGAHALLLARECGCQVVVLEGPDGALDELRQRIKAGSLTDRVELRRGATPNLPFEEGAFEGVLAMGRVPMRLSSAAESLRRYLAPRGRLVLTYPVRVGRVSPKSTLEHWEGRLGEPLVLPREALGVLEKCGYEPESVEVLADAELEEYYRSVEQVMPSLPAGEAALATRLREELDLYRSMGGKSGMTFALLIARRKEPGERPPVARDGG